MGWGLEGRGEGGASAIYSFWIFLSTANASIVSVQYRDVVQRGLVPGRFEYGQVLRPRDLPENSVVFGSDRRLVDGIAIAAGELLNKARGWHFEGEDGGQEDGGKGAGQEGAGGETGHRRDVEGEGVEYYRDYNDGTHLTNNPATYHRRKMHDFLISYVNRITDLYGDKAEGLSDLTRLCCYELEEIGTAVAEICGDFSQRLIKYVDLVLSPKEKKQLLSDADYKVFSGLYQDLKDWIYYGCPDECPVNLVLFDRLVSQGRRAKNPKAVYFDPRTQETSATIFDEDIPFDDLFGGEVVSNMEKGMNTRSQLGRKYGSWGRGYVSGMGSDERPVTTLVEEIRTLGISPGVATVIDTDATTEELRKLFYRCKADGCHFLIPMMRLAGLYEGRGFKLFSPFPAGGRSLSKGRCVTVDLKILSRQVLHTSVENSTPTAAWGKIADTSSKVFKPRNGLDFHGVVVFGRGMMKVTFDNSTRRGNQMATEDYQKTRKKRVDKAKEKKQNRKKGSEDYFENNLDKLDGASYIVCVDPNRWKIFHGAGLDVPDLCETIGRFLHEGLDIYNEQFWYRVRREIIRHATPVSFSRGQKDQESGLQKYQKRLKELKPREVVFAEDAIALFSRRTTNIAKILEGHRVKAVNVPVVREFYNKSEVQRAGWKKYIDLQAYKAEFMNTLKDTFPGKAVFYFGNWTDGGNVPTGQMSAMTRGWLPYARRHGLQAYMIDECRTSSVCPVSLDDIVMNTIVTPNGRRVWAISVCLNDDCMKENHPCECEDGTCPPGTCPLIIPHPKCFNRDDLAVSNMLFIVLFYLYGSEISLYPSSS
ncbi:hypothetical protein TRICI_002711 [Trichomonascus ciferrii]|uniref:Uncharacterized protein n=1 Tax=Trichomonascus ciferrii TaxID=44093 RepID=A0A642VBS1_9ASCO|nr:hypothetical protein TRICI_002711 [Trichomonascus ciferrii]